MADLRPLGSEKLQGQDKINRILEIANYGSKPSTVNESKSSSAEYSIQLADGNYYGIVKEKSGYIVKRGINESEFDYIEPMKNRKYYNSYSQAMKKINLMAGELNRLHENEEGINLIGEQKKFVLKTPKPEPAPAPAPEPEMDLDMSVEEPSAEGGDDMDLDLDLGMDSEEPMGDEEMDMDLDMDVESPEGEDDEEGSFKAIQKLTGKLGQKLRTYDKNQGLSSEDIKYVLNSIISAVELEKLSEEDKEDILANFEEEEVDYGMDGDVDIDVDAGEEDLDLDLDLDMDVEEPEGEMAEGMEEKEDYDDMFLSIGDQPWYNRGDREYDGDFDFDYDEEEIDSFDDLMSRYGDRQRWFAPDASDERDLGMSSSGRRMFDMYREKYGQPFKLRKRRPKNTSYDNVVNGFFSESKVDKVLEKYFVITEEEKQITEGKKIKKFLAEKVKNVTVKKEIKRLSETIEQELTSEFLVKENDNIKFLGKTNKNNLVFEADGKQFKVSPNGELLWN